MSGIRKDASVLCWHEGDYVPIFSSSMCLCVYTCPAGYSGHDWEVDFSEYTTTLSRQSSGISTSLGHAMS